MPVPDRVRNAGFEEVKVFQDPSGVALVITQKKGESKHSFSLLKTYEKDGVLQRTSYLNRRHLAAARALLDKAEEWLDEEVERSAAARAVISR